MPCMQQQLLVSCCNYGDLSLQRLLGHEGNCPVPTLCRGTMAVRMLVGFQLHCPDIENVVTLSVLIGITSVAKSCCVFSTTCTCNSQACWNLHSVVVSFCGGRPANRPHIMSHIVALLVITCMRRMTTDNLDNDCRQGRLCDSSVWRR